MKGVKKAFKALRELIHNPWLLNNVLDDNTVWHRKVIQEFGLPDGLSCISLEQISPGFHETLETFSFLGGGSLPTDIALLKALCRRFDKAKYFEIGTWRGESVRNVSDVAEECFTLNLADDQMRRLGLSEDYIDAHGFFSKNRKNITQLLGDSTVFDFSGLDKRFDVIFIDGNHHHEYIVSDTRNVFDHLIHEHSIVVWRDYAYDPDRVRFETLHAILEAVPVGFHRYIHHVANTMCAILIRDNFEVKALKPYEDPVHTYEVSIKSQKL